MILYAALPPVVALPEFRLELLFARIGVVQHGVEQLTLLVLTLALLQLQHLVFVLQTDQPLPATANSN